MERSCGAVLYKMIGEKPHFVLVKAAAFGFPKGHVEKGETEEQTAAREVLEETGVRASLDTGFRREVVYKLPKRPGRKKQVVLFLAECDPRHEPHPHCEIKELAIKPFEEALELLKHEALKNVLRDANEYILAK
ncbi:MAG: NUDIX domain-containing protein [Clostridiales bacterium]|nr:NUDIX domain-containing protein [Clostridiales bacterium]